MCPVTIGTMLKTLIIFIWNLVSCYCTVLVRLLQTGLPSTLTRRWLSHSLIFSTMIKRTMSHIISAQSLCHWRLSPVLILLAVHEETKVDGLVFHSTWMAFVWWARFLCMSVNLWPRPEETSSQHVLSSERWDSHGVKYLYKRGSTISLTLWPLFIRVQDGATVTNTFYLPQLSYKDTLSPESTHKHIYIIYIHL